MTRLEIIAFGSLAAGLVAALVMMKTTPEGEADWEAFVRDHHCVAVGATDGSNRGGWRCDDGRIHYRWRQQR